MTTNAQGQLLKQPLWGGSDPPASGEPEVGGIYLYCSDLPAGLFKFCMSSSKPDLLPTICLGFAPGLPVVKKVQETFVHEAAHLEEAIGVRGLSTGQLLKTVPALLVCRFEAELSHREWKQRMG